MSWQYHPILVLFATGGFASIAVSAYAWHYTRRHGRSYLVASVGLLGISNAVWVGAATAKTASADLSTSVLFYKLEFVGLLPISVLVLVLALTYVAADDWITSRNVALLSVIPAVYLVLALFNPGEIFIADPVFVRSHGILALEHTFTPVFAGYLGWLFGTAIAAILIIGWGLVTDRVPAVPALIGMVWLAIPLATALLKTAGVYPPGGDGVNVAPAASAIGISVFGIAMLRKQVFELIPVGRSKAIEAMNQGYILIGPDEHVLDANSAAVELLCGSSDATIQNRPIDEVLPGAYQLNEIDSIDVAAADRTIQIRRSPVKRQRQDAGEVLLITDVTDSRRRRRMVERRNQQLDQFARTISHDLRNPLNVAHGHVDTLRSEVDTDCIDEIDAALERMNDLIDELYTLARAGETVDEPTPIDLAGVVEAAWASVEAPNATLTVETNQFVEADRGRLQQLFENVFRNAIEHGGENVSVSVGALEDGFYVADDGPGIPIDERSDVFEVTYSTDGDTGFGMRIVEEIVEGHDWQIRVTDSDCDGARFEITDVTIGE